MRTVHILLVEDNEGDIVLTTEALQESGFSNKISVVRDGKLAIEFLEREGEFKDASMPDLVLLDVNLPKKNGHEVLQFLKENERLRHIPVVMLTTSSAKEDIDRSYEEHANCFVTKPVEVDAFLETVGKIEHFWNGVAGLPLSPEVA